MSSVKMFACYSRALCAGFSFRFFKVLKGAMVLCMQLMGTARQKAGAVEKFQHAGTDARLFLLSVGYPTHSCAG